MLLNVPFARLRPLCSNFNVYMLRMGSANVKRRYIVTSILNGWLSPYRDCSLCIFCTGGQDIACELSDPALITMNYGEKLIKVTYSNYGRAYPYDAVCPHPRGFAEDLACTSPIVDQLVICDGQRSCQVIVHTPSHDPCYGTGKYVEVRYICEGGWFCHFQGPLLLTGSKLTPAWVSNLTPSNVREWIGIFIPHFIEDAVTYPCWGWNWSISANGT